MRKPAHKSHDQFAFKNLILTYFLRKWSNSSCVLRIETGKKTWSRFDFSIIPSTLVVVCHFPCHCLCHCPCHCHCLFFLSIESDVNILSALEAEWCDHTSFFYHLSASVRGEYISYIYSLRSAHPFSKKGIASASDDMFCGQLFIWPAQRGLCLDHGIYKFSY